MVTQNSSNQPELTTNGELLIGSTGLRPVAAQLTAGSNITITPGAGSITIAAIGDNPVVVGAWPNQGVDFGGFKINWGFFTVPAGTPGIITITLAVPFASTNYAVTFGSNTSTVGTTIQAIVNAIISNSQFSVRQTSGTSTGTEQFYFMATGA